LRSIVVTGSFRLIVFDLDGTLVDSRRDIAEAANTLIEEHGAPPLAEERLGRMVGDGAATLVARAFAAVGIAAPADALERFVAIYGRRLLRHTRPYPRVPEVLSHLSQRSALALLTNKPLAATREILEGLDLARYFGTAVIGGDGPWPRKPHPAGLQHLVAAVGASPETTVLVGDSVIDWRTARAASTAICLARYGFGFESVPVADLEPADRLVDAPAELLSL
jgi:phosphoglycolate phosphatase